MKDGFVKVAAASPVIRVADPDYNADRVIETIQMAKEKGVKVLVFPELTLTGVTCYDLIGMRNLLNASEDALCKVVEATEELDMLVFVGLPYALGGQLYSCAAAVYNGDVIAMVPRTEVNGTPFSCPDDEPVDIVVGGRYETWLTNDVVFPSNVNSDLTVAVEVGNDMNELVPMSVNQAIDGATLIAQMASFPATVTSTQEAELDIKYRSKHLLAGMIMAAPGTGESTTDNVFTGLCMVAENGVILDRKEEAGALAISEVDVDHMTNLRRKSGAFGSSEMAYNVAEWGMEEEETVLTRYYSKNPHLPALEKDVPAYCERMMQIQVDALIKRMEYAGLDHCVVGISGGVDSTLCVMICSMAVRKMGLPSTNVVACTLPCFGTTSRTKSNAIVVAEQWGCEVRVIDIGNSVKAHFDDIGHAHDDYTVAFENAQARERTQVLMDVANKVNGLNVGTEDLSEYIDGWCTYNGDHTSMYDVNMGLTKTQVRTAVRHIAATTEDKVLATALWDVLECPVTPELLPPKDDTIEQKSEETVGSYSLQDFFTHKMLICGFTPTKTLRLAELAYGDEFSRDELIMWLKSYCTRLCTQQFKRSCLMDGPAVEQFSVSPRNGFLIPSDASTNMWMRELEALENE
ncbi:MAG: NAD(+) synthase [Oscillospiraceae bacterium]|nr:NAD(+) synthase [Oscillospiraceae bacterium]